eukprot:10860632-Prorocentrum_lima.AAC.1
MTSSLVGSEMCIRDSPKEVLPGTPACPSAANSGPSPFQLRPQHARIEAVSYTHLTLPTICSV